MKSEITSVTEHGTDSVQFKSLTGLPVRIGPEGQLFTLAGRKQKVVASPDDAADWWETNVCKTQYNATRWNDRHNRMKAAQRRKTST